MTQSHQCIAYVTCIDAELNSIAMICGLDMQPHIKRLVIIEAVWLSPTWNISADTCVVT